MIDKIILDIETTPIPPYGQVPDTIHCIGTKVVGGDSILWLPNTFKDLPEYLDSCDKIIMHGGIDFDLRVLDKILGIKIPLSKVEDTLIISRYLIPNMDGGHSLAAWGDRLGFPKIDFHDFDEYSEEMGVYCIGDLGVTEKLYYHLRSKLRAKDRGPIDLEYQVQEHLSQQEENGFPFNLREAQHFLHDLEQESGETEDLVQETFIPKAIKVRDVELKWTKDGNLSKTNLKHIPNLEEVGGDHTVVKFVPFNLGSRTQIGDRLQEFGWKPKKFTETGKPVVDEGTLAKLSIPQAEPINKYLLLQNRIAKVNKWIEHCSEEQRIHGSVISIGTITHRMTHRDPNMAQVPAAYSPYGHESRSLFGVEEGWDLVGCDASGLELRVLAHYMDDTDYTSEVIDGDIHTKNMEMAGLTDRDDAKTFIYAFIYGAGAPKIGSIVGGTAKTGKKLIDKFLTANPALRKLKERITKEALTGIINGLDGRRFNVRYEHAALNLLLQGGGAIICKDWLTQIFNLYNSEERDYEIRLVASVHDEYQFLVTEGHAVDFGILTRAAIKLTENKYRIKCPLDSEFKVGKRWIETH